MKMKHQKQHLQSIKSSVLFSSEEDKWGNVTLIATLNGDEISRQNGLQSINAIEKAKEKIKNQIKNVI